MIRSLSRLNIPLLVISLLLAITLWIVVQAQAIQPSKKDISVPLTYAYLDPNLVVVSIPPTVPVTIEGPSDKMDAAGLKNAQAVVNLHDASPGIRTYDAIVRALDPDVNRMLPHDTVRVTIAIEEKVTQAFKVVVETKGWIADRTVSYGGAQCDPPLVEYSGSQNALASIARVRAILNLDEVNPDQPDKPIRCNVDALDSSGHSLTPTKVTPNVSAVNVRPTINPATVNKDLFIIPTFVGRPAAGFEVTGYEALPERLSVTGASMRLAALSSIPTFPIDVSGLSKTETVPARLDLPQGVTRLAKKPVEVRIDIRRQQAPAAIAAPTPSTKPKEAPFPDKVPPLGPSRGGGSH